MGIFQGFMVLNDLAENVKADAKYAGADNFTGQVVDGYRAPKVVGTEELGAALKEAAFEAGEKGLGLLLFDGYRPERAVRHFMRWAEQEEDFRTKAAHYPNIDKDQIIPLGYVARRSGHSRGSTIDLTLFDLSDGRALDMGGAFDLMDERSHHGAQGITREQAANRAFLRDLMLRHGFVDYENEWWHYRLKDEPYPERYFDFVIE